jgi:hypothetical protein
VSGENTVATALHEGRPGIGLTCVASLNEFSRSALRPVALTKFEPDVQTNAGFGLLRWIEFRQAARRKSVK